MERKQAHELLFERLAGADGLAEINTRVEAHLQLPQAEKEAGAEKIFRDLAVFTANSLLQESP